jgi:hypothetical protein
MEKVTLVVVMPVGPKSNSDNVCDTIESIQHYVTSSHAIILIDNSAKGTGTVVKERFSDIHLIERPDNTGKKAALFLTLCEGYTFAYENFVFDVLLRMDDDSLVIGTNPELAAIEYFERNPDYGLLGSCKMDCNGDPRDLTWSRDQLFKELRFKNASRYPLRRGRGWFFFRRVYRQSLKYGYEPGESCIGAAFFVSYVCLRRLITGKRLSRQEISWSQLSEDHLTGLLVYSVGLRLGDFATGSLPMGLRWRGLPCSPEELVKRKKKITHSVRFFENLNEEEIRGYFRERRLNEFA